MQLLRWKRRGCRGSRRRAEERWRFVNAGNYRIAKPEIRGEDREVDSVFWFVGRATAFTAVQAGGGGFSRAAPAFTGQSAFATKGDGVRVLPCHGSRASNGATWSRRRIVKQRTQVTLCALPLVLYHAARTPPRIWPSGRHNGVRVRVSLEAPSFLA
jgi:hypothetical protein